MMLCRLWRASASAASSALALCVNTVMYKHVNALDNRRYLTNFDQTWLAFVSFNVHSKRLLKVLFVVFFICTYP